MRYSESYLKWATDAEKRDRVSDREQASLYAAKIRDNLSSDDDRVQLERMNKIISSNNDDEDDEDFSSSELKKSKNNISVRTEVWWELDFSIEGYHIKVPLNLEPKSTDRLEIDIQSYLASLKEPDINLLGFNPGSKLKDGIFTGKLSISDWDEENEENVNERVINIEGSITRMERKHVTEIPPYVPLRMKIY